MQFWYNDQCHVKCLLCFGSLLVRFRSWPTAGRLAPSGTARLPSVPFSMSNHYRSSTYMHIHIRISVHVNIHMHKTHTHIHIQICNLSTVSKSLVPMARRPLCKASMRSSTLMSGSGLRREFGNASIGVGAGGLGVISVNNISYKTKYFINSHRINNKTKNFNFQHDFSSTISATSLMTGAGRRQQASRSGSLAQVQPKRPNGS